MDQAPASHDCVETMEEGPNEISEPCPVGRSSRKGIYLGKHKKVILEDIEQSNLAQNPGQLLLEQPRVEKPVYQVW